MTFVSQIKRLTKEIMMQRFRSTLTQITNLNKLLLVTILSFLTFHKVNAQETSNRKTKEIFAEWNFGIAYLEYDYLDLGVPVSPGTSLLIGETHATKNNIVFEYEIGLAFPSIITGKLGVGKKFNNTKVVAGVRPFPFNFFLQTNYSVDDSGSFLASIEFNPGIYSNLSFESKAIFNVGYRRYLFHNK